MNNLHCSLFAVFDQWHILFDMASVRATGYQTDIPRCPGPVTGRGDIHITVGRWGGAGAGSVGDPLTRRGSYNCRGSVGI